MSSEKKREVIDLTGDEEETEREETLMEDDDEEDEEEEEEEEEPLSEAEVIRQQVLYLQDYLSRGNLNEYKCRMK